MDYLRVIRLGYGKGTPGQSACWMTALQAHMNGEWTDQCECVDPVINALCIQINDLYDKCNDERTEDILNFGLFRVLGTKGTPEDTERRLYHLVDTAVRQWLPAYWQNYSPFARRLAERLRAAPRIVNLSDVLAVHRVMPDCHPEPLGLYTLNKLVGDLQSPPPYRVVVSTMHHCTQLAKLGAEVPSFEPRMRARVQQYLFPVLAELIEMGPHETKELPEAPACGVQEFHRLCGVK